LFKDWGDADSVSALRSDRQAREIVLVACRIVQKGGMRMSYTRLLVSVDNRETMIAGEEKRQRCSGGCVEYSMSLIPCQCTGLMQRQENITLSLSVQTRFDSQRSTKTRAAPFIIRKAPTGGLLVTLLSLLSTIDVWSEPAGSSYTISANVSTLTPAIGLELARYVVADLNAREAGDKEREQLDSCLDGTSGWR
jgi:hypothetical protein